MSSFERPIDLLYLDAGETDSGADASHLREAQIAVARDLFFSPRSLVLIDDVHISGTSESKVSFSIPFLLQHDFHIAQSNYQVVLQRSP